MIVGHKWTEHYYPALVRISSRRNIIIDGLLVKPYLSIIHPFLSDAPRRLVERPCLLQGFARYTVINSGVGRHRPVVQYWLLQRTRQPPRSLPTAQHQNCGVGHHTANAATFLNGHHTGNVEDRIAITCVSHPFSPPAYSGEARVAGGAVLPEERPRMTPPLLKCELCLCVRPKKKLAVEIIPDLNSDLNSAPVF